MRPARPFALHAGLLAIAAALLAAACDPGPVEAPARHGTWTPEPTATQKPTSTPAPTATLPPPRTPATATAITPTAPPARQTVSIPQADDTVYILIADNYFSPAEVTANVGQLVVWSFEGAQQHELTFVGAGGTPVRSDRGTYSFRWAVPITLTFVCGIHPEMRGRITVE